MWIRITNSLITRKSFSSSEAHAGKLSVLPHQLRTSERSSLGSETLVHEADSMVVDLAALVSYFLPVELVAKRLAAS